MISILYGLIMVQSTPISAEVPLKVTVQTRLSTNEGMLNGQDVIVLVVSSNSRGPDFRASSRLCDGLSKIIPGISYNADKLEIEAKQIEEQMKQVEHDRKDLADNIYG